MNIRIIGATTLVCALLVGCVTYPKPLQGEFQPVTPDSAVGSANQVGTPVRWGGRIISVEPQAQSTCFEVISIQLDASGRPAAGSDDTAGRFIACRNGFYDPAVFEKDREITFTGRIDGYETRRIGEYDYRLPRLAADVIYLWPERQDVLVPAYSHPYHHPYYYGPWRGQFRGYWWW